MLFRSTGHGLHTGKKVTLTFNPAPENHWLKFQRTDVDGQPIIEADADLVVDTSRGTTLEKNGVRVHTTEHVLAALVVRTFAFVATRIPINPARAELKAPKTNDKPTSG